VRTHPQLQLYGAYDPACDAEGADPYGCRGAAPCGCGVAAGFSGTTKGGQGRAGFRGKASGKRKYDDSHITSRFIFADIHRDVTESDIREYFKSFGEVEKVERKELTHNRGYGSVKFATPSHELKSKMLDEPHSINGWSLDVCTQQTYKKRRQRDHDLWNRLDGNESNHGSNDTEGAQQ